MKRCNAAQSHILKSTLENLSFLNAEGVLTDLQHITIKAELEPLLSPPSIPNQSLHRAIPPPPTSSTSNSPSPSTRIPSSKTKVPPPPPSTKPIIEKPEQAIALWSYQSTSIDELSFSENEIITVLNKDDKDWFKGRSNATGKVGLFPSNYTEDVRVAKGLLETASVSRGSEHPPPGYDDQSNPNRWNSANSSSQDSRIVNAESGGINPNLPVPQTEEQRMKQERLKKLGGTVGNAAVGGFGAGIGFGLASAIF